MNKEITLPEQDNMVDDHVDTEIQDCIMSDPPKSFFMFAGAGSGKTRSLINTLNFISNAKGQYLKEHRKQVAVITYTNAAVEEIQRRLQYNPIFWVSTIHSFIWELIKNFQLDIKEKLLEEIQREIVDLEDKQSRGRKGTDAYRKRSDKIEQKRERIAKISQISRFTYNPNGENYGIDSLSHDEVIRIGSSFIANEHTMQKLIVAKYPFLFIDESQDTKKELVDALIRVYQNNKSNWLMGMFGDTMQRIYPDGKDNLESVIPNDWEKPIKVMNHRSAKRIVTLANSIRSTVDDKVQRYRSDAIDGCVRLFITTVNADKESVESEATHIMAKITSDDAWEDVNGYKSLILEHHMAANRFSFSGVFAPLNESKKFDTSLRNGEIPEIEYLMKTVAPMIEAYKNNDAFSVAGILRQKSPLLSVQRLISDKDKQLEMLSEANEAAESLYQLWEDNIEPKCIDVLKNISESKLFPISDRIAEIIDDTYNGDDEKVIALKKALEVPFDELMRYYSYVTEGTRFATHQGIKGLEFPRVMVVLDDAESKGFMFSYEKLFGAKEKTETDLKNEAEGKDTSIFRTTRLFYVACTRAEKSLAVVVYTENPTEVKNTALKNNWFTEAEIIVL